MSKPNFQIKLGTTGAAALKGDTKPDPVSDVMDRPGWSYTKDASSAADDKFNYFFYGGTYENMKLKHVKSMFFCGSIDQWTNTSNEAPFFVVYTKMKLDGTDAGLFYHSKFAFCLHTGTQLVRAGERCVFYSGTEPVGDFGGARSIPFRTRVDTGTYDPEDDVLFMSLHSDSGAVLQSTFVESLGADLWGFDGKVSKNYINMKLIV